MKVTYDRKTDTLTILFKEGAGITDSDESRPGVILDYDRQENLVSMEVLDASTRVTDARHVEFQSTG